LSLRNAKRFFHLQKCAIIYSTLPKGLAMDSKSILEILKEEIVPAEGCTEPIAIAYVCAKAAEILDDEIEKIKIEVSGNMIDEINRKINPNNVKYDVVNSFGKLMEIVGVAQ